jgi:hypothetical protein
MEETITVKLPLRIARRWLEGKEEKDVGLLIEAAVTEYDREQSRREPGEPSGT